jgi:hypothetical protein
LEFEGLVIEIPLTMEAGDKLTADVTIQVSSSVSVEAGSATAGEESSVEAPSGYDADLDTYIAGLATPLSTAQKDRLNTMILAIKAALGISLLSDFFDVFYVLAGETEESSYRNLVKRAHDCVEFGSAGGVDWVQFEGVSGDLDNQSGLDTNYNHGQAVNFAQNNGSIGVYKRTEGTLTSGGRVLAGVYDGVGRATLITSRTLGATCWIAVTGTSNMYISPGAGGCFLILSRDNAGWFDVYKNGVFNSTKEEASGALGTYDHGILCRGQSDGFSSVGNDSQVSIMFEGKAFTDSDSVAPFVAAIEAYMDANGKGVL